ncbi:MAG: hypothetical protein AAFY45_00035 [Bacteroidota bacterium]
MLQKIAEKLKNFLFITFLLLVISCESNTKEESDWSAVDRKIREKDSINATKLAKKAPEAIREFSGYPDLKRDSLKKDSLQKDTDPNL